MNLLSLIAQAPPASLAQQEVSVPGGTLLLIAYMGLWVVILGFVVLICGSGLYNEILRSCLPGTSAAEGTDLYPHSPVLTTSGTRGSICCAIKPIWRRESNA